MTYLSILQLIFVFFVFANADSRYCNLPGCEGKPHSMCIYTTKPDPSCGECFATGMTPSEKNKVIKYHNDMRQKVARGEETRGKPGPQPAAMNMSILTWNDELATIAQRWANQCKRGHDKCRYTSSDVSVGQNVASGATTGQAYTISDLMPLWYNEVALFSKYDISSYRFEKETGHYTQFVWANTKEIGCGIVKCNQMRKGEQWIYVNVACNYAPSGNVLEEPIYISGSSSFSKSFSVFFSIVLLSLIYCN